MAQSLLSRYDAMRCTFVRQNGKEYVEKINDFIEEVVETISDQHLSQQTSENSMQKAITFFGQPMPVLTDDSSPPNVTTVDSTALDDVKDEVAELRREVAALKREVLSLKKSHKEKNRKHKAKNSKQKENQKKIVDEVKRMEKAHQLSIHTLEKNLSKVRDFVKRNHKEAILQTQVTGASGDVAQPSGYGEPTVPAPSMPAATAMSSPQQPPKASVVQPSGYGEPTVPAPSMSAATAMSSPQQPPKASVVQPAGYRNAAVPAPSMPAATAMSSPQQPPKASVVQPSGYRNAAVPASSMQAARAMSSPQQPPKASVVQPSGYGNPAVPASSMQATAMSSPQQPPKASVAQPSGYGKPAVPAPSMPTASAMSSPQQPIRRQGGKQKISQPVPSTGMTKSPDVDIELSQQGRVDCPPGTVITDMVAYGVYGVLLAMQNEDSEESRIVRWDLFGFGAVWSKRSKAKLSVTVLESNKCFAVSCGNSIEMVLWNGMGDKTDICRFFMCCHREIEQGGHDFCLSWSHYTDTDPTNYKQLYEHLLRYKETKRKSHQAILIFNQFDLNVPPPPTTIYEHPHRDIDAITALSPTTLAAAVRSNLLLMDTKGHVYKTISIGMDIPHRAWSGTAGMSRVKDILIAWDSCGDILQIIDISTGSFTYKTVPQSRRVSSVDGSVKGHILACSSTSKELFLLGPDMDEVKKVLSIPSIIGTSAKPFSKLHVSVSQDKFSCVTNQGKASIYRISL